MNKILPILSFLLLTTVSLFAQTYDFENGGTSVAFTYFGSSTDGQDAPVVDNPNPTGINTSSQVLGYTKAMGSETWAGAYTNPNLPTPYDVTSGGQICVDVHFDHIGNLAFKLEKASNGVSNWVVTIPNTQVNEWETICYDLSLPGEEDDMTPAAGGIFDGVAIFIDFGMTDPDNDVTTYIDNIRYEPGSVNDCVSIFNFEADGMTTDFQYFGSSLQDQLTSIIANPNASGINESDSVVNYIRPAGSETWAGAFANPAPAEPIDVSFGGEVCVDVHFDHIGNIALKLEASTTGGADWIQTVENTLVNEWEQLCIDVSLNSLEGDMQPASGHAYGQIVIFPDFGLDPGAEDVTSYIDNLCYTPTANTEMYDVTFEVDMNNYTGSFTQPYVSGEFNGWSGDANPLSDDDADGIWSTTINMLGGNYEYKFQLDGWNDSDQFLVSDECTITTIDGDGNVFTNRVINVTDNVSTGAVCFNSCYLCGDEAVITWNLNMTNEEVSDDGVYVAGGAYFGHGDLPAMTDDDGDGIYTTTIRRQKGFETDYTFINGLCLPAWECKENIAGQDCAVEPFSDRHLDPVMDDVFEINTCFGECSTTTECMGPPAMYNATFRVNMSNQTVGAEGVFLAGFLINNWAGDTQMTDDDGDDIYEVTVELPVALVEYKYINGTNWENLVEDDCTMVDPSGQFINRVLQMEEKDTIVDAYLFETCDLVVDVNDVEFNDDLFSLQPNLTSDLTMITCDLQESKTVEVRNINGQLISTFDMTSQETTLQLNMSNQSAGMYIVTVTTNNYISTKRLVVR